MKYLLLLLLALATLSPGCGSGDGVKLDPERPRMTDEEIAASAEE